MGEVADIPQPGAQLVENAASASEELWRFSLAFYNQPGVSGALIGLQDRERLDANLVLFALWLGLSGRGRLDRRGLDAAERAVRAIRAEIVEPLRAMRRRLKPNPAGDVQRLREGIKALELEAEKTMFERLARGAAPPDGDAGPAGRSAAAEANLVLYLGKLAMRSPEATVLCEALAQFIGDR